MTTLPDGNTTSDEDHSGPPQLEWPVNGTRTDAVLSDLSDTSIVVACKGLFGNCFLGPDKNTRVYLVRHRKHWPLLPRLLLHGGTTEQSSVWASYKAVSFREAWIEMPCKSTGPTAQGRVKIHRKLDGGRNKYVFTMLINGREETFGWRRSKNGLITELGLSPNGYKLVRLTKGTHSSSSRDGTRTSDRMQVVAYCARSHRPMPRYMALRYLASFGDE